MELRPFLAPCGASLLHSNTLPLPPPSLPSRLVLLLSLRYSSCLFDCPLALLALLAWPITQGWCDSGNNNENCDYDLGDCCQCDCGRIVTETEVNGTTTVETIYNGTATVETTYANGTTTVYTYETEETTTWTCGYYGYGCIDPDSACVDDDDYVHQSDDDLASSCSAEIWGCAADSECIGCISSASSTDDSTGYECSTTPYSCHDFADFYCCALDAETNEQCDDNEALLDYVSESRIICFWMRFHVNRRIGLRLLSRGCTNAIKR